ncbi:hypothetical protein R3P38DRAFT_3195292 [Favolaschia claudopus]|uniref:Uncharacterized protein n=1 Tax=Favolaschia claudopus TaxID=2862362 RepID=A0AAW0BB52_9AGAR
MTGYTTFCDPKYKPDPGHEDKAAHTKSPRGIFYAVINTESTDGGVYTSEQSRDRALSKYGGDARTFTSSTWREISRLWYEDCEKHHQHSPPSTSPPTPETPPASLPPLPPSPKKRGGSPSKSTSPSKRAVSPSKSASTARRDVSPTKSAAGKASIPKFPTPVSTLDIAEQFAQLYGQSDPADSFPLMYAVSGVNRIFQVRERALAVLRRTPGADLIFADNEEEVSKFIEEEALRMRQSGGK